MIALHSDLETTGIIRKWVPDDCAECNNADENDWIHSFCFVFVTARVIEKKCYERMINNGQ